MEMERFLIAAILMIGLIAIPTAQSLKFPRVKRSTSACSSTKACLSPFPMLEEFVGKDNVKALYAASFEVVLDHLCGQKDALRTCLNSAYCSDVEVSYTATGVKDSLTYICSDEGKEKILSESKCFARDSFERGFKLCSKSLESEMLGTSDMVQLGLQDRSTYCSQITRYFKCVENEVENSCSETAADFVTTLSGKVYEPLASQLGCSLDYD